jgi:outer membrane protein assembly factor BamB
MKHVSPRLLLAISAFLLLPLAASAADWLSWRGPEQNGVSREKDLPDTWSPDDKPGNNLIWKAKVGCRSTPLVQGNHVYIINSVGEGVNAGERVMCFETDTGKVAWQHRFNVFFADIDISRVGWTNLAADPETGNLYAHGTQGFLICFSKDGKILWQRSLIEEYGRGGGYGGRFPSPVVDGDLVIVGMINGSWGDFARGANRFVAFNKKDGTVVWWSDPCDPPKGTITYYSTPVTAVINGQRLLITGCADGSVLALKVRTGEKVWKYDFGGNVINASPVVQGNLVYISHGEENIDTNVQGRIVCIDAGKLKDGKPTLVWEKVGIKAGYTSPIIHDKYLYVCSDSARLYCFEAATGKQLWEFIYGRLARGSAVWADGKIYVANVNAEFYILQPGPDSCKQLHKQFFRSTGGGGFVETNGTPSVANGRVFFGTRDEFYCIGKKDHKAKADPVPPQPQEAPAKPDAPTTHLQVVPADIVLSPGETATFKVRAFDAHGHFQKEVPAMWSLPAPTPPPNSMLKPPPLRAEIDTAGKLMIDKAPPTQQGIVLAKVGELTGRARVRVVTALPNKFDFTKVPEGAVPGGWVNVAGKFVIAKLPDGTMALKKLANNPRPPLARANAFMNLPTLHDYTVQADLLGKEKREYLPDMGLVNCRYTLILDGKPDTEDKKRRLRIISWESTPKPRVDHNIAFDWKPDVWYRVKLTVEAQKDKAIVRGKVWPAKDPEPKDWTIEFEDATPNREGAPALYGYATGILETDPGAEIYYNNVSVVPNGK